MQSVQVGGRAELPQGGGSGRGAPLQTALVGGSPLTGIPTAAASEGSTVTSLLLLFGDPTPSFSGGKISGVVQSPRNKTGERVKLWAGSSAEVQGNLLGSVFR